MYKRQIYQIAESNRIETFLPELECSTPSNIILALVYMQRGVCRDAIASAEMDTGPFLLPRNTRHDHKQKTYHSGQRVVSGSRLLEWPIAAKTQTLNLSNSQPRIFSFVVSSIQCLA